MLLNHISDNAQKCKEIVTLTDKGTGKKATFTVPGYAAEGKPALKALALCYADAPVIKGGTPKVISAEDGETVLERARQFVYTGTALADLLSRINPTAAEKTELLRLAKEQAEKEAAVKAEAERVAKEQAEKEAAVNPALTRGKAAPASAPTKNGQTVS